MPLRAHECAAPAVLAALPAVAWNPAARESGSRDQESPPPLPPDRTMIRVPLHPPRPPSQPLTPTRFFRNAECSATFSAGAASPRTEIGKLRSPSLEGVASKQRFPHLPLPRDISASQKTKKTGKTITGS